MKYLFGAALALIASGLVYLSYLGYFGGALFVPIAAEGQPTAPHRNLAAVILSGDMGFNAGMAPRIASRLANDGIPVIGVNSLVYFRQQRGPQEVTKLVEGAIRKALDFGHAEQVVLIGQSFGADMIPVALAHLPPALREKVRMTGLVVPTDTLFFRASPSELFNWSSPDADALSTARRLNWLPVICISGSEETTSLCPHMTTANVDHVTLPGGHYLGFDADAVHHALVAAINRSSEGR
jgi:type IV secretory pathway VirJ component